MGGHARKVAAVVLSILVLSATAAGPAVGAIQTKSQTETVGNTTAIDHDLTPFEKKQRALALTQDLDPQPGKQEAAAKRARSHLRNSSWRYAYRDSVRVKNKTTFETDAKAVRALGKFDETSSETTAHRASKLVVAADDESADQAIEDAWRAYEARKDTMSKGERRSAKAHIENAERALERAQDAQARAEYAENSSDDSFSIAGFSIDGAFTSDSQTQAQKGKKGSEKGEKRGKKKDEGEAKGEKKDKGEKEDKQKGNNDNSAENDNSGEKSEEKGNSGDKNKETGNTENSGERDEETDNNGNNAEVDDTKGNNGDEKGEDKDQKKGKDKQGNAKSDDKKGNDGKQNGEEKSGEKGKTGGAGEKNTEAGGQTETNGTATETPPKATGKDAFAERAQALVHLKTALKQANLALTRIDGASEPEVSIESEIDPVWQDGQPDRYYLTGNYTDVVIGEPEPVTVTVGNWSQTVEVVSASNSPMANQTFLVEVERTDRISEIEVRAPDGENDLNGTESLRLDGDGLPERIEREVGSDPLDPDSEISALPGDQADDGVHDGAAVARSDELGSVVTNGTFLKPTPIVLGNDTDADGVPDWREQELGLNASNNDTDGDGITDRYETNGGAHVDSDDDGTLDVRDNDSDGDGVIDAWEWRDDVDDDLAPGFRDLDDDGDDIPTAIEKGNVSANAYDVDFDGVRNWRDTDADGDGKPDGQEGLVDHDGDGVPAYLDNDADNDGLPDNYETNVTQTDPQTVDSDAARTTIDEAGNNVTDGNEDFDDDRLVTFVEYMVGTDPFDTDTDDDGLSDALEFQLEALDPLSGDSDDDGVSDEEEDLDNDTLSNAREQSLGTNPLHSDSDRDGLTDAAELDQYGTNATIADTDGDGLADGEEIELGTDPLDADTDGDGVLDGDETFETTAQDDATGVSVSVSGEGNLAKDVTIRQEASYHNGTAASAGPTVAVDGAPEGSETTVTMPVTDAAITSNVSVFVRTETNDRWHAVETTVDAANGTASATVANKSLVTVLNGTEWERGTTEADKKGESASSFNTSCSEQCTTADGALVLGTDGGSLTTSSSTSPSMDLDISLAGAETSNEIRFSSSIAAASLGDNCLDIGCGEGDSDDEDDGSDDDDYVCLDICPWLPPDDGGGDDGGSTDSDGDGVNDANDDCPSTAGEGSDGCPVDTDGDGMNDYNDACDATPGAADNGCPVTGEGVLTRTLPGGEAVELDLEYAAVSKGFHSSVDVTVLAPSGSETYQLGTTDYSTATRTLDLTAFAGETVTLRFETKGTEASFEDLTVRSDSDGDGLWDHLEGQRWYHPKTGNRFTTDAYSVDSDGDGLEDDEEVRFAERGGSWEIADADSDPSRADSDGDGLTDRAEIGGREIRFIDSKPDAKKFMATIGSGEDTSAYVNTPDDITSDPTRQHSDSDGLDDEAERNLGTDPRTTDTDTDGVDDGREAQIGEDPTVHDHRPPSLNVRYSSIYSPQLNAKTYYTVGFDAQDYFGLASVAVEHNGKVKFERTPEDDESHAYNAEYNTLLAQSLIDGMKGAATRVVLEDAHGNQRSRVVIQRDVAFVQLSEAFGLPMDNSYVATRLGVLTGLSVGVGETAGMIKALIEDPTGVAESMIEVVKVVIETDDYGKLLEAVADGFEQQQKLANPYDFDDQRALYEDFRTNYYAGMIAFEVLKEAAGASALKAAKSSQKLSKLTGKLSTPKLRKAGRLLITARDAYHAAGRYATTRMASGLTKGGKMSVDTAYRIMSATKTVGSKLKTRAFVRKTDIDVEDLSPTEQTRLGRLTARADGGADLDGDIARLGAKQDLDTDTTNRLQWLKDQDLLDNADRKRLDKLLDEGEMDEGDVNKFTDILQSKDEPNFFDADLDADDVLSVGKKGDLSDTKMILRGADGNVRWLEVNEGGNVGWDKIVRRHDDQFYDQYKTVNTNGEIKLVIRRVLEKADSDSGKVVQKPNPGGGTRYYFEVEDNAEPVRVSVSENGYILSAHPDKDAADLFD